MPNCLTDHPPTHYRILQDLIVLRGEKDMRLRENSPTDKTIWNLKGEKERGWG